MLLSEDEIFAANFIRKEMSGMRKEEALERIVDTFAKTKNNDEFVKRVKAVAKK